MRARQAIGWLAFTPFAAMAHETGPLHPDDLWTAWTLEPGVIILMAVTVWLYARGAHPRRGVTRNQQLCFWSGLAVLGIALLSPLHPLGEVLFSAHMAQHEILMLVAAPLLVLSRPLVPMLWGLPRSWRRGVGQWAKTKPVQTVWQTITAPLAAWSIHAIALWAWHAPALFQATLHNEWIHTAQHLSFFGSALLFWWSWGNLPKFAQRPIDNNQVTQNLGKLPTGLTGTGRGESLFYIFTTAIHTGILGALLTFAPVVIYPAYAATAPLWGLTPIEDQQLGGLIMWVPAGLVYMVAGLAALAGWLSDSDALVARKSRYAD